MDRKLESKVVQASFIGLAASILLSFIEPELRPITITAAITCAAFLIIAFVGQSANTITRAFKSALYGHADYELLEVRTKEFPIYRFVDIANAVETFCKEFSSTKHILSEHNEQLTQILSGMFYAQNDLINTPNHVAKEIGYKQEKFFPVDQFWVVRTQARLGDQKRSGIIRVRINPHRGEAELEIATQHGVAAQNMIEAINKISIENSIYRGSLLNVRFEGEIKNEYGEIENHSPVTISFNKENHISDEQIVLSDEIRETIRRNVFDFLKHRNELNEFGIPSKRGLLFYGPPGTGKTYTSQYINSNVEDATTIVVTGHSLAHVKSICNLARMLQPTIVVLEDVDLIFTSREINLYSSSLGDLLDEMDGFQHTDSILFILTTNAIDRLEKAIKDRPGRISQCIYFGSPNHELRKRYLKLYLESYDCSELDIDALSKMTDGASQAFLKELVFRAVQFAFEKKNSSTKIKLSLENFEDAIKEMTRFNEESTQSIIGFHINK